MSAPPRPGPLTGLVVADFSRVLSGPFATMVLADLGADVIKVERPGVGDDTRAWGPPFVDGESAYYLSVNRNKRSVVLDLRDDEGRADARRLAERADVLVANFRPGTMERLGLGYDELRAANPGLVYCTISGFGRGEGAALAGYDFLVQAVGGLMSITGPRDGEPTKVGVALVDVVAGLFAAVGILARLRERDRTGEGGRVDVDLLSSLLAVLVNQASNLLVAGQVPEALGNEHPSIAPYELLAAADRPLAVAVGTDGQFRALCGVLAVEALADDPRFATNAARVEHRPALRTALGQALATRPAADWLDPLAEAGVPAGPVNDLREAFALADSLGLGPVRTAQRPDGSEVAQVRNPLLDPTADPAVTPDQAPPRLGEHTDEVLAWLRGGGG